MYFSKYQCEFEHCPGRVGSDAAAKLPICRLMTRQRVASLASDTDITQFPAHCNSATKTRCRSIGHFLYDDPKLSWNISYRDKGTTNSGEIIKRRPFLRINLDEIITVLYLFVLFYSFYQKIFMQLNMNDLCQ